MHDPQGQGYGPPPGPGPKDPPGQGHGPPPGHGYAAPPQDPRGGGYQDPPGHGYGPQPVYGAEDPPGHGPSPGHGYGTPPEHGRQGSPSQGYGAPPGYGPEDPPGQGYGAPPGYGPEDPPGQGYGPPQGHGYEAPQDPGGRGYQDPPGQGYDPPPGHRPEDPPGHGYGPLPQDPPGRGYDPPPGYGAEDPPGHGYEAPPGQGYQAPGYQAPSGGHPAPGYQAPGRGQPAAGHETAGPGQHGATGPGQPPAPPRRGRRAAGGRGGDSGRGTGGTADTGRGARGRGGGPPASGGAPDGGGRPGGASGGTAARRSKRGEQRKARGWRARLAGSVPVPLVVTVAVLAVFIGAGELTVPEDRTQLTGLEPATAAVTASRVVCPDAGGQQVGVVAPGTGDGTVTVQDVGSSTGSPLDSLSKAPGRAVVEPDGGAVVASAEGGTAPGLEVEQYGRDDSGSNRGLTDVRCVTPGADWWFTGASTASGNQSSLYLSNIDRSAATVDVYAYGTDGAIDPAAGRGITVDPGQHRTVNLTELAPELPVTAVRVVARTGRVAAALRSEVHEGNTSYGASWVPPAKPRKGNLVIPAVPSGAGDRKLVLFAPGERDATVNVRVSTPDGSFAPAGHDKVDVPAQQVVEVDLGDIMSKHATALQVSSEIKLAAAVVATEGGSGEDGDVAYSATAQSLSAPATVAMVPADDVTATLQLTAPTKDAEVEVRTITSKVSEPKRVKIGAGKTVPVELQAPDGASSYGVSVTPVSGSGPVYGSRVLTAKSGDGPLLTVLPLHPGVREVTLPPVIPEIGAGVPR